MKHQNNLPVPMLSAGEMTEYAVENGLHYKKERKSPYKHFELIEQTLTDEFDSVHFCFTGIHRDWGIVSKELHAYGVTDDGLICARKTIGQNRIEKILKSNIREIRQEKKLAKDKLIIDTSEEEIQILVNRETLECIVASLCQCLIDN